MMGQQLYKVWILMRREIWESPVAFKWTPLVMAGFVVFTLILLLIIGARVDSDMAFTLDGIRLFAEADQAQRKLIVTGALFSVSALFFQILLLVVLFYLAGSLYDDRKDRSILFWKSLPVSDGLTVASKILTACLLAPALFFIGIIITQFMMLLIATVYGFIAGINPFTVFWMPANLPRMWLVLVFALLVQALWLLPIYAWLVFCSSWAPRLPILIAVAIPAVAGMLQHFWSFFTALSWPEPNLFVLVFGRLVTGVLPTSINWQARHTGSGLPDTIPGEELLLSFSSIFDRLTSLDLWIGVVIAAVLLAAAIWFRRRATDG